MEVLRIPVTPADHIQGDLRAPVTLVEYGDYECPYCGRAYYAVKNLQKQYGRQLRFVFRNLPLVQIHPYAEPAAETAEFAGAHRYFWEMHDALYENQNRLGWGLFSRLVEELGLSATSFRKALTHHEYLPRVRHDFLCGVHSRVNGTPIFFINNVWHEGAYEFEDLSAAIDGHLFHLGAAS